MTVESTLKDWPFLMMKPHLFHAHVNELVGFHVKDRLQKAMQDKATRVIAFVRTTEMPWVQGQLAKLDSLTNEQRKRNGLKPAVLTTLMAYL
jgi:hypothetical protein